MVTDFSTRHELVGDLVSLPKSSAEWDRYKLTDEQVAFYHEQGYLTGVRIFNDDQIAKLRAELTEFFNPNHAGHELWFGFSGNRAEFSWLKRRGSCVAVGRRSEHQILQSTTHADVFFAQIRIERADVPLGVDVQLNRGIGDLE